MITLRELIKILERGCQYRIYAPNRDCLIFESYLTIHSERDLDENLNYMLECNEYYTNNPYCYGVYGIDEELDIQTIRFLQRYGDCKVHSLEVGNIRPYDLIADKEGRVSVHYVEDKYRPGSEDVSCVNIFIC